MLGRLATPRVARGVTRQVPAPVGGLNARDSVAEIPMGDALILDNVFPERSWVELRKGYASWATGLPGAVETLMDYNGTTPKLFAASGTAIYDVTGAGAVGAAAVSGLTNARFQHVNFTTSAGTFLVAVNGADGVRTFDGTTWATQTISGGAPASSFACIASWKRRLWFGPANSSRVWYLPADSIAGAASALELGAVWRQGGQIAAIIAPSFESMGTGLDDYIGFVSTRGEVALYRGTDPASASTFAIVGVFRLGAPIGRRCWAQAGGDIALLTADGLVSLTQSMQLDRSASAKAAVTDKISRLFTDAYASYGSSFGWQICVYPEGHRVIVNVPTSSTTSQQYVMNTLSGAWCRYTAHNAASWCAYQGGVFFGAADSGVVYQADTGTSDNGASIAYTIKTGFSDFRQPGRLKRFTMVRPLIYANTNPQSSFGMDVDYGDTPGTNVPVVGTGSSVWGTAKWDISAWSGLSVLRPWVSVGRLGYVGALRMEGLVTGLEMQVSAFDMVYEPAGALGL